MSRLFVRALQTGLFFLLLIGSFSAYSLPASADPSSSSNCQTVNDPRVPAGTRVDCGSGVDSSGQCQVETAALKTCNVAKLGNGLEFFALALCVAGIFVSAILWAVGSQGENPGQELTGKRGLLVCLAAAALIGAYPALTVAYDNWAVQSDKTGVTKATPPTVVIAPPAAPASSSSSSG